MRSSEEMPGDVAEIDNVAAGGAGQLGKAFGHELGDHTCA
jgi:hypothetical protein